MTFVSTSEKNGIRSFARDVGVNVVANLIAAGILYLIGAGIGLLPRNPTALLIAATFVTFIPGMLLFIVGKVSGALSKKRGLLIMTWSIGLISLATILAAFVPNAFTPLEKIGNILAGIAGLGGTAAILRAYRIIKRYDKQQNTSQARILEDNSPSN